VFVCPRSLPLSRSRHALSCKIHSTSRLWPQRVYGTGVRGQHPASCRARAFGRSRGDQVTPSPHREQEPLQLLHSCTHPSGHHATPAQHVYEYSHRARRADRSFGSACASVPRIGLKAYQLALFRASRRASRRPRILRVRLHCYCVCFYIAVVVDLRVRHGTEIHKHDTENQLRVCDKPSQFRN
jgi:hypothetical protein